MNQIENENDAQKHQNMLEKSHHSSHRLGIITIALIFGLFGLWSIFSQIETTVTAEGKVITRSYNKIIMHPQGGIVKKVFVQEGDLIEKDQPLLEIDHTEESSRLASYVKKYDTNLFSICRFKAQSELKKNLDCVACEKDMIEMDSLPRLRSDAQALFGSEMRNLQAKIDLMHSQNGILQSQNNGLEKQIESNKRLLTSYQEEFKKWKKLVKSDVVDELKMIATQREVEQSLLQIGALESKIEENLATIKSNTKSINLEKVAFQNSALIKLNEIDLENRLTHDTIVSLKNTIENAIIKSPGDGLVTDMKIHTSREVISPQKQIMLIVPNNKDLIIEAYVLPTDIEKIYKGQKAEISFPAFVDPSAIPIEGELTYISADAISDDTQGGSYYIVLLKITSKGFEAITLNKFKIIPGMPVSAFIKSGKKTLMEYLTQPIIQMFKGIYHAN